MYILCLKDKENEGAYAIQNGRNERTLLLFEEIEDAERFAGLLEADDFPPMAVTSIEDQQVIATCEKVNCRYSIITPNDFVIPPSDNDPVPKDPLEKPPEHG